MPINTKVDGNPDSVAATGAWLRNRLAVAVHDTTSAVAQARSLACSTWAGPAASAFGDRMDRIRRNGDDVSTDAGVVAGKFDELAAGLRAAQAAMARARDIATAGGLTVTDYVIADPVAPAAQCFVDPQVEAAVLRRHQQKLDAFAASRLQAQLALDILGTAWSGVSAVWREIVEKKYLSATDFVGKAAKVFVDKHHSLLTGEAQRLHNQAATAKANSLMRPAGSPEAAAYGSLEEQQRTQANATQGRADSTRLAQAGLQALDKGVTIGSIIFDIANGKSPAKAVVANTAGSAVGGVAGRVAGRVAGQLVGGVASRALVGRAVGLLVVGLATGGVGVFVGAAAGLVVEAVWDHVIPDSVREKIDQGSRELLNAGKQAVNSTWHATENIAHKLWNAVF